MIDEILVAPASHVRGKMDADTWRAYLEELAGKVQQALNSLATGAGDVGLRFQVVGIPTTDGVMLIAAERFRQQTEEGYTADYDLQLPADALAIAAASYATYETRVRLIPGPMETPTEDVPPPIGGGDKRGQHDKRRRLIIAGALVAAELDRMAAEVKVAP